MFGLYMRTFIHQTNLAAWDAHIFNQCQLSPILRLMETQDPTVALKPELVTQINTRIRLS